MRALPWLPLLLAASPLAIGGQEATPLRPGEPVARKLAPGQAHVYGVELRAGQFVLGQADQRGVDVIATVRGPSDVEIGQFDGSARGPERFSFVTEAAGAYRVVITPYLDSETGEYVLSLDRVEAAAPTPEGRVDQILAPWDRPGSPGAAVAVARNGEILYANGYGYAQLEYDVPIRPTTIFHVASVSKQVTAFAVAMLADQGRLSLDDDIRTHMPELPDFGPTITIRHLIHHTSGLRDQWNLLALAGWRLDDVITRDQILRLVRRQRELNFEPGNEYLYCNTGYTLLAEIVARVTGQPFPAWTRENLFEPLGMTRTHFHDDHQRIVPGRAYSYELAPGPESGYRKAVLSYANAGATSLFTTVEDLTRWMRNLETGRVGGAAVVERVRTRGVLNSGDSIPYGFGLVHDTFRGATTVGHGGGDAGFRASVIRFPEHGLSIAILSNVASFDPTSVSYRVATAYLEDALGPDRAPAGAGAVADRVTVDPAILRGYEGSYRLGDLVAEVAAEDGRLVVTAPGRPRLELEARSPTEFHNPTANVEVTFARDDEGATRFVFRRAGGELEARRVPPFDPDTVDLAEYTGEYDSPELETTYHLVVEDSTLVARHIRHDPIALTLTGTDTFSGGEWFFGRVRFERDAEGTITGLRVSSGRVRDVLFRKRGDGPVRR